MRQFLALLFSILSVSSHAQYVENYRFPLLNAFESTLSFIFLKGEGGERVVLGRRADVTFPAGYTGPTNLYYNLYRQNHKAPLVFLLVGLGGDTNSGVAENIATQLHQQGYHVVIIQSTFTQEFAVMGSGNPYVGQAAIDARHLYEVLKAIKGQLPSKGVSVSSWGILGYSFGALVGAHVAKIDSRRGEMGFSKYVLLNPPVDLLHSMGVLDNFYSQYTVLDKELRQNIVRTVYDFIAQFRQVFNEVRYTDFITTAHLSDNNIKGIIGRAFRMLLADIIFISQQLGDLAILRGSTSSKKTDSYRYGYIDYITKFMQKYYKDTHTGRVKWREFYNTEGFDLQRLNTVNSLYGIQSELQSNKKITVLHNEDDFLIDQSHIQFLRKTLGSRLILFPSGGHLGNIWHSNVRGAVADSFESGL